MTDRKNNEDQRSNDSMHKPDAGTTHTTDPQENMEGPVSSTIQKTGEAFNTDETQREADKERDKNM